MTPAQLRAELDHHGLSPVEFAAHARVGFSTVYKWLRGENPIPPIVEAFLALLRVAGVPKQGEKT
jgi:predicted transcriptional regulator